MSEETKVSNGQEASESGANESAKSRGRKVTPASGFPACGIGEGYSGSQKAFEAALTQGVDVNTARAIVAAITVWLES